MNRKVDTFWDRFADKHWEKKRLLVPDRAATPLPEISPSRLFDAVLTLFAGHTEETPRHIRFYRDGAALNLLEKDNRSYWPRREDRTFTGYHRRMTTTERLRDYGLVIADWHAVDRGSWETICRSLSGLTARVGVSQARMDTQLFIGNYRSTPFGVHIDPTGSFHFPVVGTKRMRFWPGGYEKAHPTILDAREYAEHLGGSVLLKTKAGGVFYWPSSDWHIGESTGGFSVTWGLGYWFADPTRRGEIDALARLVEHAAVPRARHTYDFYEAKLGSAKLVARCMELLAHRSRYAFRHVPPAPAGAVDPARFSRKPMFPLVAARASKAKWTLFAAGGTADFPASEALLGAIRALNSEAPTTLAKLQRRAANRKEQTAIEALVAFAGGAGALHAVDA